MVSQFDVASMVEDVLQRHGKRFCDIDSRKTQQASLRRYEAAEWLRKMVGVVLGRDLPAEPSEEAFRNGLRSGIMLCNVLNKIQPGAIPKVVKGPMKSVISPDGAAVNANHYFENMRNFLVAIEEMGIPTFEASDLEQGGKSFRVVNSILALKSYYEWKQSGGNGIWKFDGTSSKAASGGKQLFSRKNVDLFLNFLTREASAGEKSLDSILSDENSCCDNLNEVGISPSLRRLVRELLSDKSGEDITVIVENMLSNVMEEFERRLERQNEQIKTSLQDKSVSDSCMTEDVEIRPPNSPDKDDSISCTTSEAEITTILQNEDVPVPDSNMTENIETPSIMEDIAEPEKDSFDEAARALLLKYLESVEHQQRSVKELKSTLHSAKENVQMLQLKYREDVNNLGKHVSRLANEASGYHKVVEENRKLYNQVQDLKGNIRVYCRVRPFLPGQLKGASVAEDIADGNLSIVTPSKHGKGKKTFTFNKAFGPNSTQEEVFADTQPLIRSVLDGYNVCIFAYGQTGSGKTYTMTGPKELTKEGLGVNYRALGDLFQISEQRRDTIDYEISVQMMEIYNEQVRDLLVTDGVQKRLEIRNNTSDGINVPNANLIRVTSTSDVINLMNLGHKNRAVGSTSMNDRSSRSHSCLTVHVRGKDMTSGSVIRGCMHLVDLAGSERCDKTDAVGERLKEATYINKSLSALGDVIAALAQKNGHVPYRNSKLTQLLQDSLGGQAKTLMFVHISPEGDALGETLSTLKFAERVSTIELGAAKTNKDSNNNNNSNNSSNAAEVKELKEQIASLKAALARKEALDLVSCGSSPSQSPWNSKAELQSDGSSSRRHSLDSQDFLINSPAWSAQEDKGLSNGDGKKSPEIFYQKSGSKAQQGLNKQRSPAPSRRHSLDNSIAKTKMTSQYQTTTTDDSDHELDAATSDSSDADYRLQPNVNKSKITPNVVASKLKKPSPKLATKTQEMRSQIPQPGGRLSNGVNSSLNKNGRQPASSIAGRRKPAAGGK